MPVIFDSQAFQERYQIGSIFYTKKPQKDYSGSGGSHAKMVRRNRWSNSAI
jgi:hypothetical protein